MSAIEKLYAALCGHSGGFTDKPGLRHGEVPAIVSAPVAFRPYVGQSVMLRSDEPMIVNGELCFPYGDGTPAIVSHMIFAGKCYMNLADGESCLARTKDMTPCSPKETAHIARTYMLIERFEAGGEKCWNYCPEPIATGERGPYDDQYADEVVAIERSPYSKPVA